MKHSSGVSGEGGKFAFGGTSVFGTKKATDVSEEERRKAIEGDIRFKRMTGEIEQENIDVKKKRNLGALIIQGVIAILITLFILNIANLSIG